MHSLEAFLTPESGGVEAGVSRARVGLEAKGRNQHNINNVIQDQCHDSLHSVPSWVLDCRVVEGEGGGLKIYMDA